ncbi:MAG: CarD family transcriptional regulator [Oscillospiraceae bacterium]
MFNVGDKVAYPMHGAGIIEGVENKRILGEEHMYYVLKLSMGDVKVMIPTSCIDDIGVRNIVTADEADEVIQIFIKCEDDDDGVNWNKRYRDNIDKLKLGVLSEVAHVAKTLIIRDKKKSLSNAERKMLSNAKTILISELVLSKEMSYEDIEDILFAEIS